MKKCFMPRKNGEKIYKNIYFYSFASQYHTRNLNFECSIIPGKTSKETIKLRPKHSTMKFCFTMKNSAFILKNNL